MPTLCGRSHTFYATRNNSRNAYDHDANLMTYLDRLNALENAFGNPNFDLDAAMNSLREKIKDMEDNGENTGSLNALINVLPEVVAECKKRY